MQVHFSQMYLEPGATFPFSYHFQHRLSDAFSHAVEPSPRFIKEFGRDFDVTFNVSAKRAAKSTETKGPAVFKKTKDVEYTLFLPFNLIKRQPDPLQSAVRSLLKAACAVLKSWDIDTTRIDQDQESLVQDLLSDPIMFEEQDE